MVSQGVSILNWRASGRQEEVNPAIGATCITRLWQAFDTTHTKQKDALIAQSTHKPYGDSTISSRYLHRCFLPYLVGIQSNGARVVLFRHLQLRRRNHLAEAKFQPQRMLWDGHGRTRPPQIVRHLFAPDMSTASCHRHPRPCRQSRCIGRLPPESLPSSHMFRPRK